MNEALHTYIERYSNIQSNEKAFTGRLTFKVLRRVFPKRYEQARNLYRYVRALDDAVDQHPEIEPVVTLLAHEQSCLQSGNLSSPYLQEFIAPYCENSDSKRILTKNIHLILTGLNTDLIIRQFQKPVSSSLLFKRNYLSLWPTLNVFFFSISDTLPAESKQTPMLMDAWGTYDNIADLTEDLTNGLNLIPAEDADRFGLTFTRGCALPNGALRSYYNWKRESVSARLASHAADVFKWRVPAPLAFASYAYFQSRRRNLRNDIVLDENARYMPPVDACDSR